MNADPALSMTLDDLRFVAGLESELHVAEVNADHLRRWRERGVRKPCPGCADPCDQCGDGALD